MNNLVTACLIVKNEESVIDRCLASIKDVADEIIIIDTGSTDRTREIASAYTEHIYDFEWINDFSAARNEGIRRATSQWVFVIDADEYFPPAEAVKLREFLENELPEAGLAYALSVVNLLGESEQNSTSVSTAEVPRLFPNNQGIYYTRPIHEQLHCQGGTELRFHLAPGSMYHTGYLKDTVTVKDKLNRNATIFNDLKKSAGLTAYDYFTIGNEKAIQGDHQGAIYYYDRSLQKGAQEATHSWYPRAVISLIQTYLELHRFNDAWQLVEGKLSAWNHYPEYNSLKGSIYYQIGLYDEAKTVYMEAYRTAERLAERTHVFWLHSPNYASGFPLRILTEIASFEDDTEKSIYYLTKQLIQNTYDFGAMKQLITLLSLFQSPADIQKLLKGLNPAEDRKYDIFLLKTSLVLGKAELAVYAYEKLGSAAKELKSLDALNFALLHQNQEEFKSLIERRNRKESLQFEELVTIALGSLVWSEDYFERLSIGEDHESYAHIQVFQRIIHGNESEHNIHIFELLTKTYLYQFYELYDRLVNAYANSETTNALANFFYANHQHDLAMNYYSILLKNNELNAASLENLAIYHLYHDYLDDGLEFLQAAIALKPESLRNYTLYLRYCKEPARKRAFIQRYGDKLAFYKKIPALAQLLK
ncbi:TPR domain-containing glycosyltransferase [Paenibacillus sacheonensis]|uniref:Glycosyltransferase n=1 Tax=Paenibacillus sacheonensis TaxID=742054 RepID=A0A7X4YV81_9BACL|nr:TPR domain-containing glycosyltransferase [Paenibacillus sacheonensis]MBM7566469.1 glycosyltransferase involved in cell wall biosynthesis [Paenibacillus sacheonensis]NBC73152.1 glycosyltransferase [Paenibacillus sacheonensis]